MRVTDDLATDAGIEAFTGLQWRRLRPPVCDLTVAADLPAMLDGGRFLLAPP